MKKKKETPFVGKGDWHFERSSGYAGYRCTTCMTWVYADNEQRCDCDNVVTEEKVDWFDLLITKLVKRGFTVHHREAGDHPCAVLFNETVVVHMYDHSVQTDGTKVFYDFEDEWNKIGDSHKLNLPGTALELKSTVDIIVNYSKRKRNGK